MVLDRLPGLYGFKYDSVTACGLPLYLCSYKLDGSVTFWWAQHEKENKMHWLSWELLCCRKERGGLGYRDMHLFNLAMLARQGWRLLLNPDSLCAQVLRSKCFPNGDFLSVVEKPGISYSWRSIV